jgi:CRISPR-associated protein Cas5d
MKARDQALDVWGDFACFTRPELKVERFSYPVPTPSAVRGIYDAIYCKRTEFRWQATSVEILAPPQYIALRRNEVKDKVSSKLAETWMQGVNSPEPIWADGSESRDKGRTQRQTMALRNVRYRLHAEIRPWPGFEEHLLGFEEQFRRRAAHGKCIYQPYFGCREFPAFFDLLEVGAPSAKIEQFDLDIGLMLYDVFDLSQPGTPLVTPGDFPSISFFRASVRSGVLVVPDYSSDSVLRVPTGDADA